MADSYPARRRPCANCPWRLDVEPGEFPPDRYRALAACARDLSNVTFTCHKTTEQRPMACAGFLEAGATHHLSVRIAYMSGQLEKLDRSGGYEFHPNFRAMAVANGVPADDPALADCRDDQ